MPGRPAIRPRNGCLAHPARILQALEHEHAGGKVDAVDRKRQCLGQAAAGIGESHAESADLAVVLTDDGAGIAADEGVAADVFAALDGFKKEGFAGATDLAVGGQGRFEIGQDAAGHGDEVSLGGILQKFIEGR